MTRDQKSIGSGHLGGANLISSGVNVKRPGGSRSIGSGHRLDSKRPDGSRSTGSGHPQLEGSKLGDEKIISPDGSRSIGSGHLEIDRGCLIGRGGVEVGRLGIGTGVEGGGTETEV